jgi:hypothetical protein
MYLYSLQIKGDSNKQKICIGSITYPDYTNIGETWADIHAWGRICALVSMNTCFLLKDFIILE